MAITYIDFFAENPIENKTIADSCIFENINGNGSALWTIYNSNDITITAEDTLYLNADRMWFNSSVEWTTIVSNSGMGFTTNPNSNGYSFTWNANGGKWDVDTKGGDIIFNTYNSSTLTYGAMVFPPVDKLQIGGGSNGQVLTTDGSAGLSWTTASGGGVTDGVKGNIDVSSLGSIWTIVDSAVIQSKIADSAVTTIKINNDAVTYAKMQNVSAASKLLGRGDSGSGDTQEITLGTGLTMTGTTLAASGGSGGYPTFSAFKSVNETITNAAILNTDSALFINYLPDDKFYYLELDVMYTGNGNQVFFYLLFSGTNGFVNPTNSSTINLKTNQDLPVTGSSSQTYRRITGIIQSNLYTPSLMLQWKQQFGGSLTIHAGSLLRLYRLN